MRPVVGEPASSSPQRLFLHHVQRLTGLTVSLMAERNQSWGPWRFDLCLGSYRGLVLVRRLEIHDLAQSVVWMRGLQGPVLVSWLAAELQWQEWNRSLRCRDVWHAIRDLQVEAHDRVEFMVTHSTMLPTESEVHLQIHKMCQRMQVDPKAPQSPRLTLPEAEIIRERLAREPGAPYDTVHRWMTELVGQRPRPRRSSSVKACAR